MLKKIFLFLVFITINVFPQGYICAVGGGSENYGKWSDEPYKWIVQKSDSGKIIILSVNDEDSWLINYFKSFGATNAINLKINSRTLADQQSTYDQLMTAKAIFIKGGDQWYYYSYWKGTKTEQAIKQIYANGGVIAGTSAGAMVLGDVGFTARYTSPTPRAALESPFSINIDLEDNFLDLVPNIIFDTHTAERGRYVRSIAFILKSFYFLSKEITAIAIDDATAICIEPDLKAKVMGSGSVSIFYKDNLTKFERNGDKFSVENLKCDMLTDGWSYNLNTKQIISYPAGTKTVDTTNASIYLGINAIMSGSSSLSNFTSYGMPLFTSKADTSKILIVYNSEAESQANQIISYMNSNSIKFDSLRIADFNMNDPAAGQKILNSRSMILVGNPGVYNLCLNDTNYLVGRSFRMKAAEQNFVCYYVSNAGKIATDFYIWNTDENKLASYRGLMTNNRANGFLKNVIFQPLVYENSDFYENRTTALFYGLMRNRQKLGLLLDSYECIFINKNNRTILHQGPSPFFVVDASSTTLVDSSRYITATGYLQRQTVAMNNLRINTTNIYDMYSIDQKKFSISTSVKKDENIINDIYLYQNYPNPFNSITKFKFRINEYQSVKLSVYNILGQEVKTLLSEYKNPGEYEIYFNASELSSGIYFFSLKTDNKIFQKKMILLK